MRCANAILALLATLLGGGMGGVAFAADSLAVSVTITIGTPVAPAVSSLPASTVGSPLLVSEGGTSAVAVVSLNQAPTATVTIAVANPAPGEVALSDAVLTFTPADWAPRVLLITGLDDSVVDGDQAVTLDLGPAAGGQFDGVAVPSIHVRNLDDEVPAVLLAHTGGSTTVGESGLGDTISVVLAEQPSGTVTVALAVNAQVTLSATALNFDAGDWATPKVVTLGAVDDVLPNGTRSHTLAATASGGGYDGADDGLAVTVLDNDAAALLASPGSITTSESGTTAQVQIQLSSQPQNAVTLSAASSNPGEALVSPASVVVSPANWQTPAVFTVSGVDDATADGNQAYVLSVTAAGDAAFTGQSAVVGGVNLDDDGKGVLIGSVSSLTLSEGGAPATYRVRLAQPPTATVTVSIAADAAIGRSPASLTFTTANWSTPQTVTATAVDDSIAQGTHPGTLTHTWVSADPGYNSLTALALTWSIADNDVAAVQATRTGPAFTTETGAATAIAVRLASQPASTVTVPVTSSDPGQGTASPTSLVFDASTWSTPQTITVTGADGNNRDDGDVAYAVSLGPASSTDPGYAGLIGSPVALTNRGVDHPPTLDPLVDRVVAEDSGQLLVALSGISNGQTGESQAISVTASSAAPAISGAPAVAYASPAASGTIALLPPPDANGTALITVSVSDGAQTVSRSFTLTVASVNDPPVLVRSTQLVVAWQSTALVRPLLASGSVPGQLAGADPETPTAQLVYRIVVAPNLGVLERLDAGTGAATALADGDDFTQAEIEAGLIRYRHTSSAPALADALQFQLRDADGGATPGSLAVRIDASVPAVALLPAGLATWSEGDAALAVAANATITDLDSPDFSGGRLTLAVSGGDGSEQLSIAHEGDAAGQVGFDPGTGAVRFGGTGIGIAGATAGGGIDIAWSNPSATPAAAQAVLRRVRFACLGDDPAAGTRLLSAAATDELGNAGPPAFRSIAVVPVDDPPTVAAVGLVAVAGQTVSVQAVASDPDGPAAAWSIATAPGRGSATIDAASGLLTYVAGAASAGTDTFTVAATAGGLSGTATVTVRITGPGSADRLWVTADPPLEAQAGEALAFNVRVDDSDIAGGAADLRFSLIGAPAGMAIAPDPANRQAAVTWTVASGADPHRSFAVLAWDEATGAADLLQVVLLIHPLPGGPD